jgi:hypothetical protein
MQMRKRGMARRIRSVRVRWEKGVGGGGFGDERAERICGGGGARLEISAQILESAFIVTASA